MLAWTLSMYLFIYEKGTELEKVLGKINMWLHVSTFNVSPFRLRKKSLFEYQWHAQVSLTYFELELPPS